MTFEPASNTIAVITIGCPLLVIAGIFYIRFRNKNKSSDQSNRRQSPRLRFMLNATLLTALTGTVVFICWDIWSFLEFEKAPLYFRLPISFFAAYLWLIGLLIAFIRSRNKNKVPRTDGEERRQMRGLRYLLNFLIIAPIVLTSIVLIYNLLM